MSIIGGLLNKTPIVNTIVDTVGGTVEVIEDVVEDTTGDVIEFTGDVVESISTAEDLTNITFDINFANSIIMAASLSPQKPKRTISTVIANENENWCVCIIYKENDVLVFTQIFKIENGEDIQKYANFGSNYSAVSYTASNMAMVVEEDVAKQIAVFFVQQNSNPILFDRYCWVMKEHLHNCGYQ